MSPDKNKSRAVQANVFEQRAEHLSAEELASWTALSERDNAIVQKLLAPGARLLIGPRGSGKSTLIRTAYFRGIEARQVLPVYVNYTNSLTLEPLFHRQANALQIFRQWLLFKIVRSTKAAISLMGYEVPEQLRSLASQAKNFIGGFESGAVPELPAHALSPSELTDLLEDWCDEVGISRCVLLMDDAAHAFSQEQQREFFEVFRALRSRRISAKAAVYPGVMTYSPNFHVGHDADVIEVWSRCDTEYIGAMREVMKRRFPKRLRDLFAGKEELVDLLALASFGLPRGFINMISAAVGVEDEAPLKSPTRRMSEAAIQEHAESVRALFLTLRAKLPRLVKFVDGGIKLEDAVSSALRSYNAAQVAPTDKTNVIAIREPIGPKFERVLNMLEYAGVVRAEGRVSRGEKGRFRRYSLHNAIVVAENVLALGKSSSVMSLTLSLADTGAHAFARSSPSALLGSEFETECGLELPNCPACGAARLAEEQKFCMKCGKELPSASLYEELLRAKLEALGLTKKRLKRIRDNSTIDTVQDILLDDDKQALLSIPYVGPVWAARIRTLAEEFVGV